MEKTDIVPGLKQSVDEYFQSLVTNDKALSIIRERVNKGGTWDDALDYAGTLGQLRSRAFLEKITADELPNGQMYFNIADRVIPPALKADFASVSEICMEVQRAANGAARIGIEPMQADLNVDRIDGIVNRITSQPFDEISWILDAPVQNFLRSVVDDTVKKNADFHYKAGMNPVIRRTTDGKCCKWCTSHAGTFPYKPNMDREVFRRHENCGCLVAYYPDAKSKQFQNVHDRNWRTEEDEGQKHKSERKRYSGARITNPNSKKSDLWAEDAYKEIRKRSTDCAKISSRTGYPIELIESIKDYLFVSGMYYNEWEGCFKFFQPDAAIAQSWFRLSDPSQKILPHDLTLLKHEVLEMEIKKANPGIDHLEAHEKAKKVYNYDKESAEYYEERGKRYDKSGKY